MSPNQVEVSVIDPESNVNKSRSDNVPAPKAEGLNIFRVWRSFLTLFTHISIGVITGVALLFSLREGTALSDTSYHVLLCTLGYQLLMAEAILLLAPDSLMSSLRLRHKKIVHWVLQVGGTGLAVAGTFIMVMVKPVHWNTLHGQFGLVALVFTIVSFVNGVASFYAYNLRRVIPGTLSKLTHICFGVTAMATASIALCYGFNKSFFRAWANTDFTTALIVITAKMTFIIILNPFITFANKLRGLKK